jgi:plastocyanin domain-containing protein
LIFYKKEQKLIEEKDIKILTDIQKKMKKKKLMREPLKKVDLLLLLVFYKKDG